jgi:hypothetical protein
MLRQFQILHNKPMSCRQLCKTPLLANDRIQILINDNIIKEHKIKERKGKLLLKIQEISD